MPEHKNMIANCLTKPKCPRCDKQLFCSDIEEYDYVCANCDENFYECEVE